MNALRTRLRLIRPNICVLTILGVSVGAIISGSIYSFWKVIPALLAAFSIAGAGNVINDYFDFESDQINKPERPLPSGEIGKKDTIYFWAFLNVVGISSALFVSTPYLMIALINIFIATLYSWKLQYLPVVGNIADTFLAAVTYPAGGLITLSFLEVFNSPLMILFAIVFFGNWSREVFKDIEDMEGDKKTGSRSLPILIGKEKSMWFARSLLILPALLLFYPYFIGMFGFYYLLMVLIGEFLIIYSMINDEKKSQRALKITMFVLMAAFLLGSLL